MPKRKELDITPRKLSSASKKQKKSALLGKPSSTNHAPAAVIPSNNEGPDDETDTSFSDVFRFAHTNQRKSNSSSNEAGALTQGNGRASAKTSGKDGNANAATSDTSLADRSAKRKSGQLRADMLTEEDWAHSARLAEEILDQDENTNEADNADGAINTTRAQDSAETPKRGRGRPKGAKNKRSPTPEGDLPPEEKYFFQNRMGPPQVSSNMFASLGLLSHDEYFEHMRSYRDPYEPDKEHLMKLHARSFLQWKFEMEQGYGVCVYGYGSKRKLVNNFAEWLYPKLGSSPRIVVLNGYRERVNIRSVLNTVGSALVNENEEMRLMGQPHDMVDTILTHLQHHMEGKLIILINSIDASSLRKTSTQSVLARLAAHPKVNLLASADTPVFPILWNSTLRDQLQFVFHDCTTFMAYEIETHPVDDVHELLGRKNRRIGGKEGIGFVLKSLPENARNLYRVLLTEILTVVNDGLDLTLEGEDGETETVLKTAVGTIEEIGIEYRGLYQKASEEFIASSDMNFRFLLKEFHDHHMITSRRDANGTELLGVPLSKDEVEMVLEDLVIG